MNDICKDRVDGLGISNDLPPYVKYFQEITIFETIEIPCDKPDSEKLSSVLVSPKVISDKLINTPIALSYEGQNLSGYKMVVQLNLDETIKYVARLPHQSMHVTYGSTVIKSVFVVVPSEINGCSVKDLVRNNKYAITPYVEDVYAVMQDSRTFYKYVTILVDVKFFT